MMRPALDPMYVDRTYYLAPDGQVAADAFAVMREGMKGKIGVGKLALYGREYLVAVKPHDRGLVMYTLHHAAEIRSMDSIEELGAIPSKVKPQEVQLAKQVIGTFEKKLDLSDYHDEYREGLQKIIDAKIAGEEIVAPEVEMPPKVVNLMEALRKSLDSVSGQKKKNAKADLPKKVARRAQEKARLNRRHMRFVVFGAGELAESSADGSRSTATRSRSSREASTTRRFASMGFASSRRTRVEQLDLPVFDHPARITWTADDIVLLAMKTQDTSPALDQLAAVAPPAPPIVCMQNGVANERMALQRFPNVYGVYVWCAAGHLSPGWCRVVRAHDRHPRHRPVSIGRDESRRRCRGVPTATFHAEARADIMRWKYRKLLMNLGNAVEALCGSTARGSAILAEARREGRLSKRRGNRVCVR